MQDSKDSFNAQVKIQYDDIGLTIEPTNKPYKYCLIWIHGLNYYPHRFLNFFLSKELAGLAKEFKIVIPQAPVRKSTLLKIETVSWYDISVRDFTLPFDKQFDVNQIMESEKFLQQVIQNEIKLLKGDSQNLFLGGFSQGCAMALHLGFQMKNIKLGGIIGYAGYLFEITNLENKQNQIFIIHGKNDRSRPWESIKSTYDRLQDQELIQFQLIENMDHDLYNNESRAEIYKFIQTQIQAIEK